MQNYLMSIPNDDLPESGAIHDLASKLKIRVFDKARSILGPKKGEVRYFINAGKRIIAFETEGYQNHRQVHILHMIAWYCLYRNMPNARIQASWPMEYLTKKITNKKGA